MKYAKPQITKRSAMTALCSKSSSDLNPPIPHRMTPPAYSADEE